MKKLAWGFAIACICMLSAVFFPRQVYADTTTEIDTIYPNDIIEYVDLTNISNFDITYDYVCYTLDNQKVTLFCMSSKKYSEFDGFDDIQKIKFANDNILIADSSSVKVIKNFGSTPTVTSINEINMSGCKAVDIYYNESNIFVGVINNNTFSLYRYSTNLTSSSNPTMTFNSTYFANAYLMTISDANAYIVYKTGGTNDKFTTELATLNLSSASLTFGQTFKVNAKVIDFFEFDNKDYLITSTDEILYLQSLSDNTWTDIKISTEGNIQNSNYPIFEITDITFFNNKIYVSDLHFKSIQAIEISVEPTLNLKSNEIVLASSGFSKGRFKNPNNIYIQGKILYVSDTDNNRIQIIENNNCHIIDDLSTNSRPKCLQTDTKNNLYFVTNNTDGAVLNKYAIIQNEYQKTNSYSLVDSTALGSIASLCITNSDVIYLLDITNNNIVYLNENNLVKLKNLASLGITLDENSQIEYVMGLDKLVIKSQETITIMNTDGTILAKLNIANLRKITSSFDKIIAITSNSIISYNFENNAIIPSDTISFNTTNYNCFEYDIALSQMIAFDSLRSCLVKFDCPVATNPFNFENLNDNPLDTNSKLIPLKLNDSTLIYEYPNYLGSIYNQDSSIEYCFGIEEYKSFCRIIFNNDGNLSCGFVSTDSCTKLNHTYAPITVITTNQVVPVYKYPTLLKYQGERLITQTLEINKSITLNYVFPASIDGKTFYLYQNENTIGFIFNADVVLSEAKTIKNLNTENASIKIIGSEQTNLLDQDKQTVIKVLDNNTRIYVQNYDKKQKYTKVIYKDSDLNTYTGYVLTKDIQMDKLDSSQVVLIVVIILTILLLIGIIVTFVLIKKRNSK